MRTWDDLSKRERIQGVVSFILLVVFFTVGPFVYRNKKLASLTPQEHVVRLVGKGVSGTGLFLPLIDSSSYMSGVSLECKDEVFAEFSKRGYRTPGFFTTYSGFVEENYVLSGTVGTHIYSCYFSLVGSGMILDRLTAL